jgi:hypothetical protein
MIRSEIARSRGVAPPGRSALCPRRGRQWRTSTHRWGSRARWPRSTTPRRRWRGRRSPVLGVRCEQLWSRQRVPETRSVAAVRCGPVTATCLPTNAAGGHSQFGGKGDRWARSRPFGCLRLPCDARSNGAQLGVQQSSRAISFRDPLAHGGRGESRPGLQRDRGLESGAQLHSPHQVGPPRVIV